MDASSTMEPRAKKSRLEVDSESSQASSAWAKRTIIKLKNLDFESSSVSLKLGTKTPAEISADLRSAEKLDRSQRDPQHDWILYQWNTTVEERKKLAEGRGRLVKKDTQDIKDYNATFRRSRLAAKDAKVEMKQQLLRRDASILTLLNEKVEFEKTKTELQQTISGLKEEYAKHEGVGELLEQTIASRTSQPVQLSSIEMDVRTIDQDAEMSAQEIYFPTTSAYGPVDGNFGSCDFTDDLPDAACWFSFDTNDGPSVLSTAESTGSTEDDYASTNETPASMSRISSPISRKSLISRSTISVDNEDEHSETSDDSGFDYTSIDFSSFTSSLVYGSDCGIGGRDEIRTERHFIKIKDLDFTHSAVSSLLGTKTPCQINDQLRDAEKLPSSQRDRRYDWIIETWKEIVEDIERIQTDCRDIPAGASARCSRLNAKRKKLELQQEILRREAFILSLEKEKMESERTNVEHREMLRTLKEAISKLKYRNQSLVDLHLNKSRNQWETILSLTTSALDRCCRDWKHHSSYILPREFKWTNSWAVEENIDKPDAHDDSSDDQSAIDRQRRGQIDRMSADAERMIHESLRQLIDDEGDHHPFVALHNFTIDKRLTAKRLEQILPVITPRTMNFLENPYREYDYILIGPRIGLVIIEVKSSYFNGSSFPQRYLAALKQLNDANVLLDFLEDFTGCHPILVRKILITPNLEKSRVDEWLKKGSNEEGIWSQFEGIKLMFKEDLTNGESASDDLKDTGQSQAPHYAAMREFLSDPSASMFASVYESCVAILVGMKSLRITSTLGETTTQIALDMTDLFEIDSKAANLEPNVNVAESIPLSSSIKNAASTSKGRLQSASSAASSSAATCTEMPEQVTSALDSAHALLDTYCPNWKDAAYPRSYLIPPNFYFKHPRMSDDAIFNQNTPAIDPTNRIYIDRVADRAEFIVFEAIQRLIEADGDFHPFIAFRGVDANKTWHHLENVFPGTLSMDEAQIKQMYGYDFVLIGPKIGLTFIEVNASLFTQRKHFAARFRYMPDAYLQQLKKLQSVDAFMKFLAMFSKHFRAWIPLDAYDNIKIRRILFTPNLKRSRVDEWLTTLAPKDREKNLEHLNGDIVCWFEEDMQNRRLTNERATCSRSVSDRMMMDLSIFDRKIAGLATIDRLVRDHGVNAQSISGRSTHGQSTKPKYTTASSHSISTDEAPPLHTTLRELLSASKGIPVSLYESFASIIGVLVSITPSASSSSLTSEHRQFTLDKWKFSKFDPKLNTVKALEATEQELRKAASSNSRTCTFKTIILTPAQCAVLQESAPRQCIIGVAGTGKTVLLQAKALDLLKGHESLVVFASIHNLEGYNALFGKYGFGERVRLESIGDSYGSLQEFTTAENNIIIDDAQDDAQWAIETCKCAMENVRTFWIAIDPRLQLDISRRLFESLTTSDRFKISHLTEVMRCPGTVFEHCYAIDREYTVASFLEESPPTLGHKIYGARPDVTEVQSSSIFLSMESVSTEICRILDRHFSLDQICVIVCAGNWTDMIHGYLLDFFCKMDRNNALGTVEKGSLQIYKWTEVASLEWPVVIYVSYSFENSDEYMHQCVRYRSCTRTTGLLFEIRVSFPE